MKRVRTITIMVTLFILSCFIFSVQAIKLPTLPHSFKVSSLKTPEAISNALSRLAAAFSFLSPKTLSAVIRSQSERLDENMKAFKENKTAANAGRVVASALATAAAAIALTHKSTQQTDIAPAPEETMIFEEEMGE